MHSTSQHSTARWSDRKFARQEAGLRASAELSGLFWLFLGCFFTRTAFMRCRDIFNMRTPPGPPGFVSSEGLNTSVQHPEAKETVDGKEDPG